MSTVQRDPNRRTIEEMSHAEAADTLLGQVVRYERDRANRNDDRYDPQVKLTSAQIHAVLAVEVQLARIADILGDGT